MLTNLSELIETKKQHFYTKYCPELKGCKLDEKAWNEYLKKYDISEIPNLSLKDGVWTPQHQKELEKKNPGKMVVPPLVTRELYEENWYVVPKEFALKCLLLKHMPN